MTMMITTIHTSVESCLQHRESHGVAKPGNIATVAAPNIETDGVVLGSSVYPRVSRCGNVANIGRRRCAGGRRTDSVGIKIVSAFIQELRIECSFSNEYKREIPISPSFFFPQFCESAVVATVTWMIQLT